MSALGQRPIRVLIADDSTFFQQRIERIIEAHPNMSVVALAANGREALEKAQQHQPDVITMDYEMPVMDGLTAVKAIMAACPTPILMFSSLTYNGARVTLDALAAGAVDFLPKNFAEVSREAESMVSQLHEKIVQLAQQGASRPTPVALESGKTRLSTLNSPSGLISGAELTDTLPPALSRTTRPTRTTLAAYQQNQPATQQSQSITQQNQSTTKSVSVRLTDSGVRRRPSPTSSVRATPPKVVLLGASTGGPVAVSDILKALPESFPVPIVIIQHMPEQFTKAFAERLNRQCALQVTEARDGDALVSGRALLAPGGQQMVFNPRQPNRVNVMPGDDQISYRPALDITFASAAKVYGHQALAVVLTGMGSDGCRGGQLMHQKGSRLWAQDEPSSVIYGMPKAITQAGVVEKVLPLPKIAEKLEQYCS